MVAWAIPLVTLSCLTVLFCNACDNEDLIIVKGPAGIYSTDGHCEPAQLHAGADACPSGAQLTFDEPGMDSMITSWAAQDVHQSCQRSFCGAGALSARASLRYRAGAPRSEMTLVTNFSIALSKPIDMRGKNLSSRIFVEDFTTSLHGQMFVVVDGNWYQVDDGPLPIRDLWNEVGGLISPANPRLMMDANRTTIPVSEIVIQIYLPSPVESGDREHWSSNVYIDEIVWR